jgi:hypothetical protein
MAHEFGTSTPQEPITTSVGEPAYPALPVVDLTRLTPTEIIAVNRYSWQEYLSPLREYGVAIYEAIEELPGRDPARGLAVFELMAASTHPDDRSDIVRCIAGLIKVDHDNGLRLFDQLIRDSDGVVRSNAAEVLDRVLLQPDAGEDNVAWTMEQRAAWGVSAAEVERLQLARMRAERAENRFELGAVALQKLIEAADEPPESASS